MSKTVLPWSKGTQSPKIRLWFYLLLVLSVPCCLQLQAQNLSYVDLHPPSTVALPGSLSQPEPGIFELQAGGTGAFRSLGDPPDGSVGGDEMGYACEVVSGDFDRRVRIVSLKTSLFTSDGQPFTPQDGDKVPGDVFARGGIMLRSATNHYSATLKVFATNPGARGANRVEVRGRGTDGQAYSIFSRSYVGVSNALPNQWLRIQRVASSFSFYVSGDGTQWRLISHRYQEMPSSIFLGLYGASSVNPTNALVNPLKLLGKVTVRFADYGPTPVTDVTPLAALSTGTFDSQTVGVKFSKPLDTVSATDISKYQLDSGRVTSARVGIFGDAVYLTAQGLSPTNYTLTVTGVLDAGGNAMAQPATLAGKKLDWDSRDIGYFQDLNHRPTPGDDPYRLGLSVPLSSDVSPEIDTLGGGSNAYNEGDFIHYTHLKAPISGDFDVAFKVSRFDGSANSGCCARAGLMVRSMPFFDGLEGTVDGTKVPLISNDTYHQNAGNAGILLFRKAAGENYDAGHAHSWSTPIGDIKGYYSNLNGIDSVGTPDPASSSDSARYLRVRRQGDVFQLYMSYNGIEWVNFGMSDPSLVTLPKEVFVGFAATSDVGVETPPFSAYPKNGHTIDPADPLNPSQAGGSVLNESNYVAQRIQYLSSFQAPSPLQLTVQPDGAIQARWTGAATLQSAQNLDGPWVNDADQSNPRILKFSAQQRYFRLAE